MLACTPQPTPSPLPPSTPLAAKSRAGNTLLDLREIPAELARQITFVPVEDMSEVLEAALARMPRRPKGTGRRRGASSHSGVVSAKGRR